VYEAAGASSSQELGFVLSTAIGYIQGMMASGMDIDTVAPLFAVKLALGSNIFMEIAKIRAFRLLWTEMIKAFGGNENSQKVWIHGKTGRFNKTTYDLYVNMLRTTTESFSAVIGGVDSLEVEPFDALVKKDNPFARRIARNQQLILREEAHLSKVIDAAGGSYYIESITAQFAEIAWKLMQDLEKAGGMIRSLRAGKIHELIAEVAEARIQAVQKRRDVVVGVNMYANLTDEALSLRSANADDSKAAIKLEKGALPRQSAVAKVEALRTQIGAKAPKIFFLNMGPIAEYKPRADFASGFFQMGGFDIVADQSFNTAEEAAEAAKASGAQAFCIVSTDANYESLVAPLCKLIQSKVMILAGYPADKVQQYKADGIDIFIHLRANAYDTLKELAECLEVL
ncbi:MAG: methylmalonyl-CoA mutase family protein, partial [Candidatus Cloacimonadaceae bacterium]